METHGTDQWMGASGRAQRPRDSPFVGGAGLREPCAAETSSNTKDGNCLWVSAKLRCYSLPRAAVTADHTLVAENNRNVCFTVLEARCLKPRCQLGHAFSEG